MAPNLFQDPRFGCREPAGNDCSGTTGGAAAGVRKYKEAIRQLLDMGGIGINGSAPHDIRVCNEKFYERVLKEGSLGLGESYMDGWWECECLGDFFARLVPIRPEEILRNNLKLLLFALKSVILNPGRRSQSFRIGERHYDLGNDLYRAMLDRRMVYSCAYWEGAATLDEAQERKLDLICRKLGLKPGRKVLDIGCGWGSFARYAAEKYGAHVVGVTVSKEQAALGSEMCRGLPVELRLQDYRDIDEEFDHVVSVGMFEHVGCRNYRLFMEVVHRCLKPDGLFLLHTIGNGISQRSGDIWVNKYIFPNSMIPSVSQISGAAEGLFVMEDLHNFGSHYEATLNAWFDNFEKSRDHLKERYDERFCRMWEYYLKLFTGVFRSRYLHVWQIVFARNGVPGGYLSVR